MNGGMAASSPSLAETIVEVLRSLKGRALFVSELAGRVQRLDDSRLFESAIAELADRGVIVLRDNYCADPHLDGIDLRIVTLVPPEGDRDGVITTSIDATWNAWLRDYLANHRCS